MWSQAREADQASFDDLFLRYYGRIYDVLFRLTGDAAEADDLAQETFIRLYRQPPAGLNGPSRADGREHNLGGWLYRVAVNLGYNALRSARRRTAYELVDETSAPLEPEAAAAQNEDRQRVRQVLKQLEPQQAQLLILRYAGLSYKELALALDVAPTSIGTLLARAERAFEARYRAAAGSDGAPERAGGNHAHE